MATPSPVALAAQTPASAPEIDHNAPDPPPEAEASTRKPDATNPHVDEQIPVSKPEQESQPQPQQQQEASQAPLAVRFKSVVEEIAPLPAAETQTTDDKPRAGHEPNAAEGTGADLPEVTPEELKALSKSLQGRHLQERRMNVFAFEPFSLPASRVHSYEDSESRESSRLPTPSSMPPNQSSSSPRIPAMASPPLTPAGTDPAEPGGVVKKSPSPVETAVTPSINEPHTITPQASSSHESPTSPGGRRIVLEHRPASAGPGQMPQRSTSAEEREHASKAHRRGMFSIGPGGSTPVSRESSPSRTAASQLYSKPFTPSGDVNDPYAASKRSPQQSSTGRSSIDPRFIFSRKKKSSPTSSTTSLNSKSDRRHSGLLGAFKAHGSDELTPHPSTATTDQSTKGSMADLKRFFKTGAHAKAKRDASPAASSRSGVRTPPGSVPRGAQRVPFGDDHGLTSKYGKLGRVLGSGAGGSVRIMKRSEDNTVFAVKEFRPRHSYETEKEYVKKLTAEFCVGSTLHHGNIIETLDIAQEKGKWFEVMEYAPFDLFAIVMTGRMTREEIRCCFLQILNGVTYLHSMGLAHRDLKLDNVVVSEFGIMKIIDFGSAHVFKYPFESSIVPASGIVGSDPYLAPEVYDERKYDPQAVDIWSLAIIFCCMSLRRFPWKVPRMTDSSFRLFAAEPTPGHDPKKLIFPSRSTNDLSETPARDIFTGGDGDDESTRGRQHRHHRHQQQPQSEENGTEQSQVEARKSTDGGQQPPEKKEVIRGPWRILRLLPRESRHVIGRMLELKPKERAKMPEILEEAWIANTIICQQSDFGRVVNADDHDHVLEPPASSTPAPSHK